MTLSKEQLQYARERMEGLGRADRCDLRLQDYRDVEGQFDGIASIEMIEAVGKEHWDIYFQTLHDRLKPGGVCIDPGNYDYRQVLRRIRK